MLKINCINLCYFKLLKFTKKKIDVLASTLKKFKTKEQMKNEMMPCITHTWCRKSSCENKI